MRGFQQQHHHVESQSRLVSWSASGAASRAGREEALILIARGRGRAVESRGRQGRAVIVAMTR